MMRKTRTNSDHKPAESTHKLQQVFIFRLEIVYALLSQKRAK
jgi:hypothetical protein